MELDSELEVEAVGEKVGGCDWETFVPSPWEGEEPGRTDGPGPMVMIWSLVASEVLSKAGA